MKIKRTIISIVVLGLVVAALAAWYLSLPEPVPTKMWTKFAPPDSGCELDVPGKPIGNALKDGTFGREYVAVYTWIPLGFDFGHFLAYQRYTSAGSRTNLDEKVRAELMDQFSIHKAEVVSEKDIQLGPHSGKEIVAKGPDKTVLIARIFVVKSRPQHETYMLFASGKGAKPTHRDITRFLDTFKIDH